MKLTLVQHEQQLEVYKGAMTLAQQKLAEAHTILNLLRVDYFKLQNQIEQARLLGINAFDADCFLKRKRKG